MDIRSVLTAVTLAATAAAAPAACLTDAQAQELVAQITARTPAANPEGLSEADGDCSRGKVTALLERNGAKVIGYKAGLTNPAVQKRFNHDKPVWGKLYQGMVLADGAKIGRAHV